jgi:hypothetical protein
VKHNHTNLGLEFTANFNFDLMVRLLDSPAECWELDDWAFCEMSVLHLRPGTTDLRINFVEYQIRIVLDLSYKLQYCFSSAIFNRRQTFFQMICVANSYDKRPRDTSEGFITVPAFSRCVYICPIFRIRQLVYFSVLYFNFVDHSMDQRSGIKGSSSIRLSELPCVIDTDDLRTLMMDTMSIR